MTDMLVDNGIDRRVPKSIVSLIGDDFPENKKYLLVQALTRKSYAKEQNDKGNKCEHQDVLSTLGDGILRAVLTEMLIDLGFLTKGKLSKARSELEKNEKLAAIARKKKIKPIFLSQTERDHWDEAEEKILSSTLEALIGAIYLAAGFKKTKEIIGEWFREDLPTESY